ICNREIVKFDLEVKALIQDIRDCSGPLSALTKLNTKVKEKFQQLRYRIQELERSSEKQHLLQEVENHKKQMQRKTTKESLAQTSSTITESLMGISRMMSQQVQQSEASMSGTIQLGQKLITKYNRRELTDKLLIFLALALFLATVFYIVKKRLFPFL
uniref:Sec20 C-terminal domain-containing protein n=1 Tax=Microcebus murinus TaxID=30608 RepID=A0A8C5Y478_MICMU